MLLVQKVYIEFMKAKIESKLLNKSPLLFKENRMPDQTPFGLDYYMKCKKRLLRHIKSDLIFNMDNMRISGIEPSSAVLNQTQYFKSDAPKVPK